jgi:hypothetical protein
LAPSQNHRTSTAARYPDVRRDPALPGSLEQGLEAPDLCFIRFRLRGLQLPEEREKPLV